MLLNKQRKCNFFNFLPFVLFSYSQISLVILTCVILSTFNFIGECLKIDSNLFFDTKLELSPLQLKLHSQRNIINIS